jgi:putative ABC transport system permease protein
VGHHLRERGGRSTAEDAIAGVALGLAGAVAIERYANLGVVLNGQLSLVAMAFAAGVGILFGFYPAWKASLLQPVEALRSD